MKKIPTSFKVFIAVISIISLVFLISAFFAYYQVNKKYSLISVLLIFTALAFTAVGIYTGFKYKTDEKKAKIQNRIGLIGNLLIFLFTLGLMAFAALSKAG
jgi:hypothetical protein